MIRTNSFIAALVAFACVAAFANAQNILVTPNRIVFDDKTKSARVIVSNPGDKAERYRVEMIDRIMDESGAYVDLGEDETFQESAAKMVKFSPKRFALEPQSSQTIRMKLRKPKDIVAGEYRSHMRVQVVPDVKLPESSDGKLAISVQVNYGITMPVIVRHGQVDYAVAIDAMEVANREADNARVLNLQLSREGNRSAYGDVTVTFTDAQGEDHILTYLHGISVFSPNSIRKMELPLALKDGMALRNGTLKVTYTTTQNDGGKMLAERSMPV